MSSLNESVIQLSHKYQNFVKKIFLCGGIYKYQKASQKLTNTSERFLRIFLHLCHSRFRLIISQQKFSSKSRETEVEKNLFTTESGIQMKYG